MTIYASYTPVPINISQPIQNVNKLTDYKWLIGFLITAALIALFVVSTATCGFGTCPTPPPTLSPTLVPTTPTNSPTFSPTQPTVSPVPGPTCICDYIADECAAVNL